MINGEENLSFSHRNQDDDEEDALKNHHDNFKGIYFEDNAEQQYYEGGAHFSYKDLCYKLENVVSQLSPDRKGKSIYEEEFISTHGGSSFVKTKTGSEKIVVSNKDAQVPSFAFNKVNKKVVKEDSSKKNSVLKKNSNANINNTLNTNTSTHKVHEPNLITKVTGKSNSDSVIDKKPTSGNSIPIKIQEKKAISTNKFLIGKENNLKESSIISNMKKKTGGGMFNFKYTPNKIELKSKLVKDTDVKLNTESSLRGKVKDKSKEVKILPNKKTTSPVFKLSTNSTFFRKGPSNFGLNTIHSISTVLTNNQGFKSRNKNAKVANGESLTSQESGKKSTLQLTSKVKNTTQINMFASKSRNINKQTEVMTNNNLMTSNSTFNKKVVLSFAEKQNQKSRNINKNEVDTSKNITTDKNITTTSVDKFSNTVQGTSGQKDEKIEKNTLETQTIQSSNKDNIVNSERKNNSDKKKCNNISISTDTKVSITNKFKINNNKHTQNTISKDSKPTIMITNVMHNSNNVGNTNLISSNNTTNNNAKKITNTTNITNTITNTNLNSANKVDNHEIKANTIHPTTTNPSHPTTTTNTNTINTHQLIPTTTNKTNHINPTAVKVNLNIKVPNTRNPVIISESKTSINGHTINQTMTTTNNTHINNTKKIKVSSNSPVKIISISKIKKGNVTSVTSGTSAASNTNNINNTNNNQNNTSIITSVEKPIIGKSNEKTPSITKTNEVTNKLFSPGTPTAKNTSKVLSRNSGHFLKPSMTIAKNK